MSYVETDEDRKEEPIRDDHQPALIIKRLADAAEETRLANIAHAAGMVS